MFSRATLKRPSGLNMMTFCPEQVRPKSEIYTSKRDDEHPHPFHVRSPPPEGA